MRSFVFVAPCKEFLMRVPQRDTRRVRVLTGDEGQLCHERQADAIADETVEDPRRVVNAALDRVRCSGSGARDPAGIAIRTRPSVTSSTLRPQSGRTEYIRKLGGTKLLSRMSTCSARALTVASSSAATHALVRKIFMVSSRLIDAPGPRRTRRGFGVRPASSVAEDGPLLPESTCTEPRTSLARPAPPLAA